MSFLTLFDLLFLELVGGSGVAILDAGGLLPYPEILSVTDQPNQMHEWATIQLFFISSYCFAAR
jgi:hypothetical protein